MRVASKALHAGELLRIPEMWVYKAPEHSLGFDQFPARGKVRGVYRRASRSLAFPVLTVSEVLERLNDPETDDSTYHESRRNGARNVLAPRRRNVGDVPVSEVRSESARDDRGAWARPGIFEPR